MLKLADTSLILINPSPSNVIYITEALQKWMPRFLANSFLALNSVLNKQNVLFCLNQLNLNKYTTLVHKKHNLSPENCLLEI